MNNTIKMILGAGFRGGRCLLCKFSGRQLQHTVVFLVLAAVFGAYMAMNIGSQ